MNNANDDAVVYKLATSDNPNALPRVAVLPVQAVGDSAEYGFLPDVLKSEINYTITAIDGITVVAISTGADVADDLKDYYYLMTLLIWMFQVRVAWGTCQPLSREKSP